ncbi:hypothetical protein RIF29_14274 [Crotalaria pallida]|uniref:Uncharacterized protein n=1 Tax=Crotalaria pallida TaxID=3830 RepID=A0AAN9FGL5_CROPI
MEASKNFDTINLDNDYDHININDSGFVDNNSDDDNSDDSDINEYDDFDDEEKGTQSLLKRYGMNINIDKDDEGNTERSTKDDKTRKSTRGETEVHEIESNYAGMPNTKVLLSIFEGNKDNEKELKRGEGEAHETEQSNPTTTVKSSKCRKDKDKGSFKWNQGNAQEDGCISDDDSASTKGHQSPMVGALTHGDEHFSEVMPMSHNFGGVHVYHSYTPLHSLPTIPKLWIHELRGIPNFHIEHLYPQRPQVPNSPVFPQVYPRVSNVINSTRCSALLQEFMKKDGQH